MDLYLNQHVHAARNATDKAVQGDKQEDPLVPVVDGGNKSTLNLATRVKAFASQATAPAVLQALSERMMGLEPTTFCMASRRSSQLSYIRVAAASIAPVTRRRGPR
jgi:hypothetical protein